MELDHVDSQSELTLPTRIHLSWKDFQLVLLATLLLLVLAGLAPWLEENSLLGLWLGVLRLLLGFACVLYVPGYCLQAVLFPRGDDLDSIERMGLSLGLSIAWSPVLALLLDRLPWGLHLWPIVWGQTGSILLFTAVALWRRSRLPVVTAYAPEFPWRPGSRWRSLVPPEQRIYKLLVGALLLAGISTAWIFLVPSPDEFMTEFYMLGREGRAEDFPREARPGEELQVTLGIANHERRAQIYRVEVWAIASWAGGRQQVTETGPISLSVGESREWPIQWRMPWPGNDQVVAFLLFTETRQNRPSWLTRIRNRFPLPQISRGSRSISGDEEAYRRLRLWLNVLPVLGPPTQVAALPSAEAVPGSPTTPMAQPAVVSSQTAAAPLATTIVPMATPLPGQTAVEATPTVVTVPSQPKGAVLPGIVYVTADRDVAIYPQPEDAGDVVALVAPGQKFLVTAQSEDGRWWQVCCVDGEKGWVRQAATAPVEAATTTPQPTSPSTMAPSAATPLPVLYTAQDWVVYSEPATAAPILARVVVGQRSLIVQLDRDGIL